MKTSTRASRPRVSVVTAPVRAAFSLRDTARTSRLRAACGASLFALTVLLGAGCGSDAVDSSNNGNGYPSPPTGTMFDAGNGGTAGEGGSGSGSGSGGSGGTVRDGGGGGGNDARDGGGGGGADVIDAGQPDGDGGTVKPDGDAGDGRSDVDGDSGGDSGNPDAPPGPTYPWSDGVIYYIFVDRFLDSNAQNNCNVPGVSASETSDPISPAQYHGGDWAGITSKIKDGYFRDLGVNAIMITSPMTNVGTAGQGIEGDTHFYSAYHGYWPTKVDPTTPSACFGSMSELQTLVATAHANSLKVLFDHTIVHVHVTSDVYTQHNNWFWTNNGQPWCTCGTTNCGWDPVKEEGLKCWFTDYLPHWNYTVPDARSFAVQMTVDWISQYGIDGLRLDAIKHVDEQWLLDTRSAINAQLAPKRPTTPVYLVGETVDGNVTNVARYVDPATKLDGQFDFPTRAQIVATVLRRGGLMSDLATWMDQHTADYVPTAVMSTILGTHDMMRVIHHAENTPVGKDEWDDGRGAAPKTAGWSTRPEQPTTIEAYERLANGFAVLFTNKGAPLIYYGDEIGLAGAGDPDNRRMMQWSGLSTNQQWLHDRMAKLLKIRAAHIALRSGTRATISATANVWAYTLTSGADKVHVVVNRGDAAESVTLPASNLTELVEGGTITNPAVSIPARQTRIYQ